MYFCFVIPTEAEVSPFRLKDSVEMTEIYLKYE